MAHKVLALLALLALSTAKEQTRWSRQISSYTSDISDWVPLSAPVEKELPQIKRQAVAEPRILSEPFLGFVRPTGFSQDNFPSRGFYNQPANRQLYLQSVPSAPQNYLSDQGFGQGLRFGLTQPNFPLSQGFIAPQFNFDTVSQSKQRPQSAGNPIKFENTFKTTHSIQSPVKPFINPALKSQPEMPKFMDGYRIENSSDYNLAKKKLPSQKVKFEDSNKSKEIINPKSKLEREEVQLLYVPLESLNRGQFNFRSPLSSAQIVNSELYDQGQRTNPLLQNFADDFQRPAPKPMETINSQEFLTNFNSQFHEMKSIPKFSAVTNPFPTTAPTTPKPKKLKPHQPPLAIFLTQEAKKEDDVKVGDVLYSLKSADTVAVLDSVNPLNAPKVFIGPSSLTPPEKYVKFELPYLSNIENIDKKLRQLPFFVAPLSYKTPQGFAKIPFPSPHVGSVVINSQIKDTSSQIRTTTTSNVYNNPYAGPTLYRQEQKPVTQIPKISYYSTSSPNVNTPNYEQNYYSIEPQSVNTLRPFKAQPENILSESSPPIKSNAYYSSNLENQYKAAQFFPKKTDNNNQEQVKHVDYFTRETTTQRTTVTSTTKPTSTYPSQLLETHNPYSINQAFHFSTPLDRHNFFEEHKDSYVTPGAKPSVASSPTPEIPPTTPSPTTTKVEETYQTQSYKPTYQSSPNYLQSYTPEIHNEYENQNLRYPVFNINDYLAKTETTPQTEFTNSNQQTSSNVYTEQVSNLHLSEDNNKNIETQAPTYNNYTDLERNVPETFPIENNESTKSSSEYNHYDIGFNYQELQTSTASSTTTTTRRNTVRTRGRPRYPTTKSDSGEYSTRASVVTRRPLRERKPLPARPKYEPNKITTEKPIRKPYESSESTTRPSRTRTRGRIHYRPSNSDDVYTKRNRGSSKENDLAYQRDVLHQNYPVTLMERTSTVDIEAITEPSEKAISTNNVEISKTYDTEDAYSNDKPSITEPVNTETKDLPDQYTTALDSASDSSYVSKVPSQHAAYSDQSQNVSPQDVVVSYDEAKEDNYSLQTSPEHKIENQDDLYATRPASPVTEQNIPIYSINDQFQPEKQEDITLPPEEETNAETQSQETNQKQEQDENIVETTPSYNRVRIRPGVIRQYHQQSSDSSRLNNERRRPLQTITYRPTFDKHRTTMRIEEIEADLKTKQVHTRPEYQDYKQPVYKPEPTTESIATSSTTDPSTRRGQFRRRRPTYSSSTESTVTRKTYEVKNRFRGRRPTEKPTEKPEVQADVSTTTVKNNLYSRYRDRPRLSERYNKKPETEDQGNEDQDSNYSINRPKYAEPESDRWSPKISRDSFKPYNPNNIADDTKVEINREKSKEEELDIITAKNEYEDILISVTPATNNRAQKKIPDIPPTLEALVEQTKVTKSDSSDGMSTFESMLEEVMKSLEEQDENEYTGNVMKHKGGEIGEIPPERIISSGENYSLKSTTPLQEEVTTPPADTVSSPNISEEVPPRQNRRRGFWKKVRKVRPASDEIEVAESQYYSNVVNRLGQTVEKGSNGKSEKGNGKVGVTTYKPNYQFLKDFFDTDEEDDQVDVIPNIEIPKITAAVENKTEILEEYATTMATEKNENYSTEKNNPGDMDLGTGSPSPTLDDNMYYTDPTEPTTSIDRSDRLSFMDYLFGETSENIEEIKNDTTKLPETTPITKIEIHTEANKLKATTESTFIPEEFTAEIENENAESVTEVFKSIQRLTIDDSNQEVTEKSIKVETSSVSSFMNPANVVSTSMSTEVSHETEICFRGKCIKTNRNLL